MSTKQIDPSKWSGDGDFTIALLEALQRVDEIDLLRVEDSSASRIESGYNFISNEIYVRFASRVRHVTVRRLGILPATRPVIEPSLTLQTLDERLASIVGIGQADVVDAGMLQYLRAQRIVPAYQTRGFKLVEMVRVYEIGPPGPVVSCQP